MTDTVSQQDLVVHPTTDGFRVVANNVNFHRGDALCSAGRRTVAALNLGHPDPPHHLDRLDQAHRACQSFQRDRTDHFIEHGFQGETP